MSRALKRIRMAVIGQGHFAQAAVLPAIEQLDDVELTALVSGSDHKLDELGERYGVRTRVRYDQLDKLLASGSVDAVYIAVPNDMHAELTLVAARRPDRRRDPPRPGFPTGERNVRSRSTGCAPPCRDR